MQTGKFPSHTSLIICPGIAKQRSFLWNKTPTFLPAYTPIFEERRLQLFCSYPPLFVRNCSVISTPFFMHFSTPRFWSLKLLTVQKAVVIIDLTKKFNSLFSLRSKSVPKIVRSKLIIFHRKSRYIKETRRWSGRNQYSFRHSGKAEEATG